MESTSVGLIAGRYAAAERLGQTPSTPPSTTALGALLDHITGGADEKTFQPMNVNFGLFPDLDDDEGLNEKGRRLKGKDRKQAMSDRARRDLKAWLGL